MVWAADDVVRAVAARGWLVNDVVRRPVGWLVCAAVAERVDRAEFDCSRVR